MKTALTSVRSYLLALIPTVIAFGISIGIYFITDAMSNETGTHGWNWYFIAMAFAFLYLLAGVLIKEYNYGRWRKKNSEYAEKIPVELRDSTWKTASIPLISSIYVLIILGVLVLTVTIILSQGGSAGGYFLEQGM